MSQLSRIVSGGQTGVDRAAFDAAIALGLSYGGFVPRGRRDENGEIPRRYTNLVETTSKDVDVRTRMNVEAADATLVLSDSASISPGTEYTLACAHSTGKPVLVVDLSNAPDAAGQIRSWVAKLRPATLNVAGPRNSEAPGLKERAQAVLEVALKP